MGKLQTGAKSASRVPRVCLVNLGCPKNQVDSETALGLFQRSGFLIEEEPQAADVVVVNTCAFIRTAEEETIQTVLEAAKLKKHGNLKCLMVVGCWVAKYGEQKLKHLVPEIDELALPGDVNQWVEKVGVRYGFSTAPLGTGQQQGERPLLSGTRTAFLKIAEGCSRQCSFCLIPALRGPLQSRPPEEIIREAKALGRRGILELIVVAQDTTRYGYDLYGRPALTMLLAQLVRVSGVRWIRVMYTNPDGIEDSLLELMAKERKLCNYLDIPVQHVNPAILKAMRRTGDAETFLRTIERVRQRIPDVSLRTTLLTGFPGESEAAHREVLQFMQVAQFDRLGVFTYSQEKGTRAAALPRQVHPRTRERRKREIMEAQARISLERLTRKMGQVVECLVEEPSGPHHWVGRTKQDAPEVDGAIVLEGKAGLGTMVRARITGCTEHDLEGVIL